MAAKKKAATSFQAPPADPAAPISICNVCYAACEDLKVNEAAPATNSFRLAGDVHVSSTVTARMDFRVTVPGENRCDLHWAELLGFIDLEKMAKDAIVAKLSAAEEVADQG